MSLLRFKSSNIALACSIGPMLMLQVFIIVKANLLASPGLQGSENSLTIGWTVSTQYQRVTDRQTDGQPISITCAVWLTHVKNRCSPKFWTTSWAVYSLSYHIISYHIISYHIISYYITLYYIILYYIMLCYVMLCYVMLYYIILYYTNVIIVWISCQRWSKSVIQHLREFTRMTYYTIWCFNFNLLSTTELYHLMFNLVIYNRLCSIS